MTRGTTPTFTLTLPETVDLSLAAKVYATFKQDTKKLTKTGDDITVGSHTVDVFLSQEETLSFYGGDVEVQLNWTYDDGKRACTNIVTIHVLKNLEAVVLQ